MSLQPRLFLLVALLAASVLYPVATHRAGAASAGLVAAYSFDETAGTTAADASGNGNNGTLAGATFATGGKYGGAVSLNGSSARINVPDAASLDLTSGMTLEAWVRPTSYSSSQTVIAKERPGGGFPYGLELDNGSSVAYADTGTFKSASDAATLPLATWTFVAATFDGSSMRVYVNGAQVASVAQSGSLAQSNGQLSIGGDSVWGEWFAGKIDNVRIYSRALSASELQSDQAAAVAVPAAPKPAAAYAFDEGSGSTAADTSGNGNTATLASTGWTGGKWNAAGSFDGTRSLVTAADSASLDATTGLTLEAWVKPAAFATAQTLIAKERPGGGFPYGLELDNGVPTAYVVAGTNATATAAAALPIGTWSFVAATYDGSALRVYVNGSQVASAAATGLLATSNGTLSIGADAAWGEHLSGAIDNVRVYSTALTAAQLAADMNAPVAAGPPADTAAPSTPTGLSASGATQTSVALSWNASTDNIGVAGYDVYVNGSKAASPTATSYTAGGLACGTAYAFAVDAYDAAGNTSAKASVSASTTACPAPAGTANLWIDQNGGSCTRQASPSAFADGSACGSFGAALRAASAGDLVLVRCNSGTSCTFSPETLSGDRGSANVVVKEASGYNVSFEESAGSGTYVWLNGLRHVTFQDIGFGRNNSADSSPNLRIDCTRDVTLVNASGRRFYMFEGNANVTFKGGDWGGYSGGGEEDSTMGTTGGFGPQTTCAGDSGPQPQRNIVFDGVTWHDVFWISSCTVINGGQCSQWGAAHPDCFEINGYVDGVTIQNSTFYHCGNTMLSLYTDQGAINNVVVRNSTFRDMSPNSYYGIQWVTTAAFTCSGDKFLNNTYTPNAPNGWLPNTPPRFECRSGGIPTEVAGNTIQQAVPSQDCSRSKGSPYNTNYHDNTYMSGSC